MVKRVLIVGMGSIGNRHSLLFNDLGSEVATVSRRGNRSSQSFLTIQEGIREFTPDVIFICTETSNHYQSLLEIGSVGFRGVVVIEKPIFDVARGNYKPSKDFRVYTAYNLRFHPLVQSLRKILADQKILSAIFYVGQYLPTWREGVDYRESYSAKSEKGGGALLDLSHELDLATWLLGQPIRCVGRGGKWSSLEIDSIDMGVVLAEFEKCNVATVHMNYLDRIKQRFIVINTDMDTYKLDFIQGSLVCGSGKVAGDVSMDTSYFYMNKKILEDDLENMASYEDGVGVLKFIKGIELSFQESSWRSL